MGLGYLPARIPRQEHTRNGPRASSPVLVGLSRHDGSVTTSSSTEDPLRNGHSRVLLVMLILEMFGLPVCFGEKSHSCCLAATKGLSPCVQPLIYCSAKRGTGSASPVPPSFGASSPDATLSSGSWHRSGVELGFTLGEVGEARGSIAVSSLAPLAPLVLLPEDPLRAAAGAGIPRLGQNSLKHQKLHLGGWQKQRLSWDGSTLTLPFLCPWPLRGLAILLWRHHCPQRPPQPPPEEHHDFLKTTTTSQRPPRSPEAPTTVTTSVQIPAQPGWAPQTLPVPPSRHKHRLQDWCEHGCTCSIPSPCGCWIPSIMSNKPREKHV